MANYKQTDISGSEYTRCGTIRIINPLNRTPSILFEEEKVLVFGPDKTIFEPQQGLQVSFDPTKVVDVTDPVTNAPTGTTVTYYDIYKYIYSAYMNAALERDSTNVI